MVGWSRIVELLPKRSQGFIRICIRRRISLDTSLKGLEWNAISQEKAFCLERPFKEEQLESTIWNMGTDKAPGPNGFSAGFFQVCWDIVKADLLKVL